MQLVLPSQFKKPKQNIWDYHYLFAGGKKAGKTAFVTQAEGHYMLEFEVGNAQHLEANYDDVSSWEEMQGRLKLIEDNPNYCKVLILDGIDTLYRYGYSYVRQQLKMVETEKDDFDVWRTLKNIMYKTMERVRRLPCGKIYTVHTEVKEATDIKGRVIHKLETTMGNQQTEIMDQGYTHFWGVIMITDKGERTIRLIGDSFIKAGHSLMENHFRYKGYPIKEIPMGSSPEEAYNNFNLAFHNQLVVKDEQLLILEQKPVVPQQITSKVIFKKG